MYTGYIVGPYVCGICRGGQKRLEKAPIPDRMDAGSNLELERNKRLLKSQWVVQGRERAQNPNPPKMELKANPNEQNSYFLQTLY